MTSPSEIPKRALEVLRDPEHEVFLSVVTGWEIAIKRKVGRLELPGRTATFLADAVAGHDLSTLAVTMEHAVGAGELPLHHKDPFDRLLVAQAQIEQLVVAITGSRLPPVRGQDGLESTSIRGPRASSAPSVPHRPDLCSSSLSRPCRGTTSPCCACCRPVRRRPASRRRRRW